MGVTRPFKLIGLDFGTTTTSALIARACVRSDAVSGRREIVEVGEPYRPDIVFTPFVGECIDEVKICELLDGWLVAASARPEDIIGGGAILTGLCARRANAGELTALIRERIGGAVVATADDPGLESFLAFMGGAAAVSRARPGEHVLNLDIGGGTTNLALGVDGEVLQVGCLFVGARHVEVVPGSHRVVRLSEHALRLFAALGISARPGDSLTPAEVAAVLEFQVGLLEAAVRGDAEVFNHELAQAHVDLPFQLPPDVSPWLTFTGGVGALLHARLHGQPAATTTVFGDLGGELAERILASPVLTARMIVPEGGGRATARGLLRNMTRLSGSTLYLPRPELLPLCDMPIFGRISEDTSGAQIAAALGLVRRSARGGCLAVSVGQSPALLLKTLAGRIGEALRAVEFPAGLPLVLLVRANVGKALGGYVSDWGRLPVTLIVLDEVEPAGSRFVQIGRMEEQVVPVSFHGF